MWCTRWHGESEVVTRTALRCTSMSLPPPSPALTVAEVGRALTLHGYLPDQGLTTAVFLALSLRRPAPARGRGRRRQDRGRQGAVALDGRRADPPAVLRGHRRRSGLCMTGTTPASSSTCAPPRPPARPRAQQADALETELYQERFLLKRAVLRAIDHGDGPPPVLPHRRGRSCRRRVRGVPPRGAERLPGDRPRARDVHRRDASPGDPHLEPHPRRARRPQATLPLPLGGASRRSTGRSPSSGSAFPRQASTALARQVAAAAEALRGLNLYKPPGVAETIDWAAALGTLGVTELTDEMVESTLGTVLKYREDHERVQQHGARRSRRTRRRTRACLTVDRHRRAGIAGRRARHRVCSCAAWGRSQRADRLRAHLRMTRSCAVGHPASAPSVYWAATGHTGPPSRGPPAVRQGLCRCSGTQVRPTARRRVRCPEPMRHQRSPSTMDSDDDQRRWRRRCTVQPI